MQGLASKNNRSRVECVDLLAEMLEEEGLHACERGNLRPFAAVAQVQLQVPCGSACQLAPLLHHRPNRFRVQGLG